MKEFSCPKCSSQDVFIKETGNQIGLYCGDCGKWIKWLGKEEKRLAERWIESRIKQTPCVIVPFCKDKESEDLLLNSIHNQ